MNTLKAAEAAVRHASARCRLAEESGDPIELARARIRLAAAKLAVAELTRPAVLSNIKAARTEYHHARYALKELTHGVR